MNPFDISVGPAALFSTGFWLAFGAYVGWGAMDALANVLLFLFAAPTP